MQIPFQIRGTPPPRTGDHQRIAGAQRLRQPRVGRQNVADVLSRLDRPHAEDVAAVREVERLQYGAGFRLAAGPEFLRDAEVYCMHARRRHAQARKHFLPDEFGIDDDRSSALDDARHAALEPPDAIARMRLRIAQPREVVDADDDGHVVPYRNVVRLVVDVDRMAAQAARERELLLRLPELAPERNQRLDEIPEPPRPR